MKASKQRKIARAIVSSKSLQRRESARITAAQNVAYENRYRKTNKFLEKRFKAMLEAQ